MQARIKTGDSDERVVFRDLRLYDWFTEDHSMLSQKISSTEAVVYDPEGDLSTDTETVDAGQMVTPIQVTISY